MEEFLHHLLYMKCYEPQDISEHQQYHKDIQIPSNIPIPIRFNDIVLGYFLVHDDHPNKTNFHDSTGDLRSDDHERWKVAGWESCRLGKQSNLPNFFQFPSGPCHFGATTQWGTFPPHSETQVATNEQWTKSPAICCIYGIILPHYVGIIYNKPLF